MRDSEDQGIWKKIPVIGKTPGKRYGHSLSYLKPYFVLFGGNEKSQVYNDVWIISLETLQYSWQKVEFPSNSTIPCSRLYHSLILFQLIRNISFSILKYMLFFSNIIIPI